MVERFNENPELDYSELEVFVPELEDLHWEVERGMWPEQQRDLTEEEFNVLTQKDTLTKDEMKAVVKYANEHDDRHNLDLHWLKSLDVETATELIEYKWWEIHLNWLTSLDAETARALAEFEWGLVLNWLTSLDAEIARALAEFKGYRLTLDWLASLDAETARALAEFKGQELYLNWLTSLDVETATELIEYKWWELYLNWLTSLDAETVRALAEFKGYDLYLNWLTSLDAEIARALAEFKGEVLYLNWLTSLDAETARALAEFKWSLRLKWLTSLDVEIARALAESKWGLVLNWLTGLDVEIARALAEFKWYRLTLGWLTSLDEETARALAEFKWKNICLSWIENVSDEVAWILIPIKSKIKDSILIRERIEEVERKIMDGWLNSLQRKIENTKKKKDWKSERWNVEYKSFYDEYDEEHEIRSWWNTVEVERKSKDTIKLKWFNLILTLEEWMWLANFKNWFKHTYPGQKVEFKKDKLNKKLAIRKTLCVGNKMLMSRHDLEERLPYMERDGLMEALVKWLNLV